jgi:hypothetical protein
VSRRRRDRQRAGVPRGRFGLRSGRVTPGPAEAGGNRGAAAVGPPRTPNIPAWSRGVGRAVLRLGGAVVGEPLQCDGIPGAVAREAGGERAIVLGDPNGRVHVESGVRPGEHARGLVFVEESEADEKPEHRAPERLGQARRVVGGPRDERPVWPEAAVGDEQVQVRMPVGPRPMRLQARHEADSEVALPRQRANGGGDGAGGDAGDFAEETAARESVPTSRLSVRLSVRRALPRPMDPCW